MGMSDHTMAPAEGGSAVIHTGRRASCSTVKSGDRAIVRKTFRSSIAGWRAFFNERKANRMFRDMPWMTAWLGSGVTLGGRPWFDAPMHPAAARMDRAVAGMTAEARNDVAVEALSIILDLYVSGYAHRDFHAGNIFVLESGLKLMDFEFIAPYPAGNMPRFTGCYDITGEGLPSPGNTRHMGYQAPGAKWKEKSMVSSVTGVSLSLAVAGLQTHLKRELLAVSTSFQTRKSSGRHTCKANRIYCSFSLPNLTVALGESQRNSAARFLKYNLSPAEIEGKRVLDLGCHAGSMLFEAQKLKPKTSLGIEYDPAKVHVARRVAAFADLDSTGFRQADVDCLSARDLGEPFDVVFCFAIEKHVKKPARLYELLGKVTRGVLLFETNAGTDPDEVERFLKRNGFGRVARLGCCDDDVLPENNFRHMIKAWK